MQRLIGDRKCENCHKRLFEHCTVHMLPCCPGKCSGVNKDKFQAYFVEHVPIPKDPL
jgi:hypothetical protein